MTHAPDQSRTTRKLWIPITIVAIALGMIAFVIWGSPDPAPAVADPSPTEQVTGEQPGSGVVAEVVEPPVPERIDVARLDPEDPLAVGPVDAPVTIIVFSDFQCGFCALWSEQTLPVMLDYVEAGQARIEWRDIAVLGDRSLRGAHAGYAAGLQGEYVAFHQALFLDGNVASGTTLSQEGLVDLADSLGLDPGQFEADLVSADTAAAVQVNLDEAARLGAFSTPVFFINGLPVRGAQPTDTFVSVVESELAQAS